MNWEEIWNYVLPIGGGITVGALIVAIGTVIMKKAFSKVVNSLEIKKAQKETVDKGLEQIKTYTFKHTIQPLVNSELVRITEMCDDRVNKKLERVEEQYAHLVDCVECLASYFDNSIGVSEDKKENFKKALKRAKGEKIVKEDIVVELQEKPAETPIKAVEKVVVER